MTPLEETLVNIEIPGKVDKEILTKIYEELKEKGYNPIMQIAGWLITEDPTYITGRVRPLISKVDRYDLLEDMLENYLKRK